MTTTKDIVHVPSVTAWASSAHGAIDIETRYPTSAVGLVQLLRDARALLDGVVVGARMLRRDMRRFEAALFAMQTAEVVLNELSEAERNIALDHVDVDNLDQIVEHLDQFKAFRARVAALSSTL